MAKPNNHQQPTKEELQQKEQEAIAEAEKIEAEAAPEEPEETPKPEAEETVEEPEEAGVEAEVAPLPEPEPEAPAEPEEQAEPSKELYKRKFSASSREAQKLAAKNRVIIKSLADAEDVPEPTEEELIEEYRDWDMMSDIEKTLAKETVVSKRWRQTIAQAKEQATKIEKWNESVEDFVEDPKTLVDNPDLEGKTDDFRVFAAQEANNSVPFNILVSAFLHDHSANQKPNKGRMFEKGSGGPNDKPQLKKGTITLEEARQLRTTNYPKYKEMLMAGKIESDL